MKHIILLNYIFFLYVKSLFNYMLTWQLKEVATETDGPGWMEQSTIISRDTGTDPVAEALESYMQAKKGLSAAGMLAPDIFMGLNFSEAGRPGPSTARVTHL